ncbi:hypothetical protein J1N35_024158 [Gossypium stocksii]|uniref:Uncharacterized protein n=1 Tax=Gossypium stocksii TaxID=47602 RepID=A0A9D4A4D1_9ROSI|nr:hypothetical protein J1N35_024158 [Gossypium stocksii]
MGNRREATSIVTSTLTGLIDDNFNENEENVSGSDVSSSDVSGSDSDASERMRCSKGNRVGHNKKSCKEEVGQNIPVKRHQVDVPTQQQATSNQQEGTPTQQAAPTQLPTAPTRQQAALRQKLPFKRKPTTVR